MPSAAAVIAVVAGSAISQIDVRPATVLDTIAFQGTPDIPSDAVVVLRDPVVSGSSLRYSMEVLDGTLPATSGAVTLFIDPLGRPLSPVSLAGMNRRNRRRDRRR